MLPLNQLPHYIYYILSVELKEEKKNTSAHVIYTINWKKRVILVTGYVHCVQFRGQIANRYSIVGESLLVGYGDSVDNVPDNVYLLVDHASYLFCLYRL